jgi:transcriptional regulator with GAF, ATPase, and Fis domain
MPALSRRATMLACLGAVPLPAVSRAQSARHGDPVPAMAALAGAVAAEGQPDAGLAGLDKSLGATVGHKLFTVLVLNWDKREFRRFYSSQPKAYPVGSSRPTPREGWYIEEVVRGGRPRISRDWDAVKADFADHDLIRSLGCESCVNVPVRWKGTTLGTLNLLHEANWYTDADLPVLTAFAAMSVPVLQEIVRRW